MEHVSWEWVAFGLICVAVMYLPRYFLNKREANRLLKEIEEMRILRKREDLLFECALCMQDIPRGDSRWMLMLNRAKEIDEEIHKIFPKEDIPEIAPLVRQYTFLDGIRQDHPLTS